MLDPVSRLRICLPLLTRHLQDVPDPGAPDGVVALQRLRYQHLAEVEQVLTLRRRHDGLRTEDLLTWHCVAQMWLEILAGQPGLETARLPLPDRAVVDLVVALLLWHLASRPHGFHPTQRLVQFCLLGIDRAADAGTAPATRADTPEMRARD